MEMIIIVAMITTMTMTMFTVSYKDRDRKDLEATGREVAASIRETQNYALTGKQGGKEGMPCAFRFYVSGQGFKVQGHYRAIEEVCSSDTADSSYNGDTGKILNEADLSKKNITIVGRTSEWKDTEPDENTTPYIVYQVPFAKYIDEVGASSKGVDIVLSKDKVDRDYHICVHAIGLIEEIGLKDKNVDNPCGF